jgi:hypothetical protein
VRQLRVGWASICLLSCCQRIELLAPDISRPGDTMSQQPNSLTL